MKKLLLILLIGALASPSFAFKQDEDKKAPFSWLLSQLQLKITPLFQLVPCVNLLNRIPRLRLKPPQ